MHIIFTFIIVMMLFVTGCNDKKEISENIISTEIISSEYESKTTGSRIEMIYKAGPEKVFDIMPVYYQQDYSDVMIGEKSIAEAGNLITILAMICSYEESTYITPDIIISEYSQCFKDNKTDKENLLQQIANKYNREVMNEPLDVEKIAKYINEYNMYVMIRIPHPSMYGNLSTYLLITDITEDGDFVIRDSNYDNIQQYAHFLDSGEPVYSSFSVCAAAGSTAQMYTFPLIKGENNTDTMSSGTLNTASVPEEEPQ